MKNESTYRCERIDHSSETFLRIRSCYTIYNPEQSSVEAFRSVRDYCVIKADRNSFGRACRNLINTLQEEKSFWKLEELPYFSKAIGASL